MKNKIAFVGFGELGAQLLGLFSSKKKREYFFLDDILFEKKIKNSFPFKKYSSDEFKECDFVIALGYRHLVKKSEIANELISLKRKLITFIHPSSFIHPSANIGQGSFVYPMCNIDKQVEIGNGVLLNNSVCASHNCIIGDGCYISPGVIFSGNVTVGEGTFIGSGTVISNNVHIGREVKIGVGSVITKNIPDGCSAIGNPAKILQKPLKLI